MLSMNLFSIRIYYIKTRFLLSKNENENFYGDFSTLNVILMLQ